MRPAQPVCQVPLHEANLAETTAASLREQASRIRKLMLERAAEGREQDYLPLRTLLEKLETDAAELERRPVGFVD